MAGKAKSTAHPAHLPDGSWGLKSSEELEPGTAVQCESKAGKKWDAVVGECVGQDQWGFLYRRADQREPARDQGHPAVTLRPVSTPAPASDDSRDEDTPF